jgi:hypothetical protein
MKRRGQSVTLVSKETGEKKTVVVVLADSKLGYLAADPNNISPLVLKFMDDREWDWYHPNQWGEV